MSIPAPQHLPARPQATALPGPSKPVRRGGPRAGQGAPGGATAAPAPAREDGGGRAFFPVPDYGSADGGAAVELSEAEKYLLEVRKQHAALPAFTKVLNPYSRGHTPTPVPTTLLTSEPGASSSAVAAPVAGAGRHPFEPTDVWRRTFLAHFLDLRANLVHRATQPDAASNPAHGILPRYLPVPKNGDGPGWKRYMLGAKRRRVGNQPAPEALLPTAPEAAGEVAQAEEAHATEGMNVDPSGLSVAGPTLAVYAQDDEEDAINDGAYDAEEEEEAAWNDGAAWSGDEADSDDDNLPMTAEQAFDAFEFGDWYDPAGEDGAGADGHGAGLADDGDDDDDSDDAGDDEVDEADLEPLQDHHVGREPSLSLIQGFSDKTTLAALKHITTAVLAPSTPAFPPALARWAFALLAHVDPTAGLLSGEQTSTLRSLARACQDVVGAHARALAADTDADGRGRWLGARRVEERAGCWMVWAAVVGVWAQRDLEDEMARALTAIP